MKSMGMMTRSLQEKNSILQYFVEILEYRKRNFTVLSDYVEHSRTESNCTHC